MNPRKYTNKKFWLIVLIASIITGIGLGYGFFLYNKREQVLTTEQLYNKYARSVVLIKQTFLYKIHIGNSDHYFKEYDPQTGEIPFLTSNYDSIKQDPIVIWGTGFFIDDKGTLLTCRHVVDVAPSKRDQERILNFFKEKANGELISWYNKKSSIEQNIQSLNELINNYGYTMSTYEYAEKTTERNNLSTLLYYVNDKINFLQAISSLVYSDGNFVTKTSLQFGIFLNETASTDLNDYIKCKVVKVSTDEKVDLATIQTESKTLPNRQTLPVSLTRLESDAVPTIKLSEKVRMIGYNYGILLANTTNGIRSQITEGAVSQNSDNNKILYTIPALQGSSGSPVFDEYGRLVSVNFARISNSQSFNYGISPMRIKEFLGDRIYNDHPSQSQEDNKTENLLPTTSNTPSKDSFVVIVDKAYFHTFPNEQSKRAAYLERDAKEQMSTERNGFIYVIFTNTSGQTSVGWISKDDIKIF